jgi:peptidoglycan glycosyltransferase
MLLQRSFRQLLMFFFILFLAVSGWVVYWQVGRAADLEASPYNPRGCVASNIPKRGNIYDRNGILLAESVEDNASPCGWRRHYTTASLSPIIGYFDPTNYGITGLEKTFNSVLAGYDTSQLSDKDYFAGLQDLYNKAKHERRYGTDIYLTIDSRVQKTASDAFEDKTLHPCSLALEPDSKRGSVIVEDPHTGEILAMVSEPYYDANKLVDHSPNKDNERDQDGNLLTGGEQYYRQLVSDPNSPLITRPIQEYYVPGSTFKTLTLIAGLDTGTYTLNDSFSKEDATSVQIYGKTFDVSNVGHYPDVTFPLDITHNFAYSNNVAFARMAYEIDQKNWLEYAQRFGLSYGEKITDEPFKDFELKVNSSWVYKPGAYFSREELKYAGFGQSSLEVTPLVMSIMTSAVAADGKLFPPHLLYQQIPYGVDRHTISVKQVDPLKFGPNKDQNAMSVQTARDVRTAMRAVVEYGSVGTPGSGSTITKAKTSFVLEGGKTGTGQQDSSPQDDQLFPELSGKAQAWFIATAPIDQSNPDGNPPRLSVVIQRVRGNEGTCQSPIALKIFEATMQLPEYAPKKK